MFFERIDAELKKNYKGKKLMQLSPSARDKISEILRADVQEIQKYFGANAIQIYIKDEESSMVMWEKMGLEETIDLLESALRRASRGTDKNTIKALASYRDGEQSNIPSDFDEDMIRAAFNEAIAGLSPKDREKVAERMKGIISWEIVPDLIKGKNDDDEDSLLDDLLK